MAFEWIPVLLVIAWGVWLFVSIVRFQPRVDPAIEEILLSRIFTVDESTNTPPYVNGRCYPGFTMVSDLEEWIRRSAEIEELVADVLDDIPGIEDL